MWGCVRIKVEWLDNLIKEINEKKECYELVNKSQYFKGTGEGDREVPESYKKSTKPREGKVGEEEEESYLDLKLSNQTLQETSHLNIICSNVFVLV